MTGPMRPSATRRSTRWSRFSSKERQPSIFRPLPVKPARPTRQRIVGTALVVAVGQVDRDFALRRVSEEIAAQGVRSNCQAGHPAARWLRMDGSAWCRSFSRGMQPNGGVVIDGAASGIGGTSGNQGVGAAAAMEPAPLVHQGHVPPLPVVEDAVEPRCCPVRTRAGQPGPVPIPGADAGCTVTVGRAGLLARGPLRRTGPSRWRAPSAAAAVLRVGRGGSGSRSWTRLTLPVGVGKRRSAKSTSGASGLRTAPRSSSSSDAPRSATRASIRRFHSRGVLPELLCFEPERRRQRLERSRSRS